MNYDRLIEAITEPHAASVGRAARAVNQTLVLRNWVIGAHLVEYEQEGEDRATYGARLVENMAADLRRRGLKGLGVSMLRLSRRFSSFTHRFGNRRLPNPPSPPCLKFGNH